jgi:hypothetical protein
MKKILLIVSLALLSSCASVGKQNFDRLPQQEKQVGGEVGKQYQMVKDGDLIALQVKSEMLFTRYTEPEVDRWSNYNENEVILSKNRPSNKMQNVVLYDGTMIQFSIKKNQQSLILTPVSSAAMPFYNLEFQGIKEINTVEQLKKAFSSETLFGQKFNLLSYKSILGEVTQVN